MPRSGDPAPLDLPGFLAETGVSRETGERLAAYAALLVRWQRRINLVGPATIGDLWRRHMLDSAQLLPLLPPATRNLIDLGSGAGFPGLVLAILGVPDVHLVDSDGRKAAFLAEAARAAHVQVTIHARRIDALPALTADVITARALAPLGTLCRLAAPLVRPDTVLLLPKGQDVDRELTDATKSGIIDPNACPDRIPSRTDRSAIILRLRGDSLVAARHPARRP